MNCLLIIIAVILFALGILICVKCNTDNKCFVFGPVFIIISVIGLFISVMVVGVRDTSDTFARKYNETKYMIDTYSYENDKNLDVLYSIINRTKILNSEILSSKKYHDNIFIGFMYSKDVGDFELIELDTTKLKMK